MHPLPRKGHGNSTRNEVEIKVIVWLSDIQTEDHLIKGYKSADTEGHASRKPFAGSLNPQGDVVKPECVPSAVRPATLIRDDEIAVRGSCLDGPDVWVDTRLQRAVFFSDRLVSALKKARVDKPFRFIRCRVVVSG